MAKFTRVWNGKELQMRGNRAAGRGIIGIGMVIARETKILTHKLSGTLARSVHVAPAFYEPGYTDEQLAEGNDLMSMHVHVHPTHTHWGPAIEVGSWVSYACVEWIGRGHPGVTEGLEAARPSADGIMWQAFREEGL